MNDFGLFEENYKALRGGGSIYKNVRCVSDYWVAHSELFRLSAGCLGLLFCLALLISDRDVVVGLPVVEHAVELAGCINLFPGHVLVAELTHLYEELIKLLH